MAEYDKGFDFMDAANFGEEEAVEEAMAPTEPEASGPDKWIEIEDGVEVEKEWFRMEGQPPALITRPVMKRPNEEYEAEMWDVIDGFEQRAWSAITQGIKTGWDHLDKAFDNCLNLGQFIVVGGDSNLGKSGFMSQLEWQIATSNDDVYVMAFSLDDAMQDKLARVIGSSHKIILNAVKNPNNYTHLPLMLQRRKDGVAKLRGMCDRYRAYDARFTTFVEEIEEEVRRQRILHAEAGISRRIVVCIDNMHDLNIRDNPSLMDKQKYDFIAQWCSDLAIKEDVLVIATAELKKLNGTRRPALDDIREAVKIKYEAKAILLVYNEVHYKGEGANVFFYKNNVPMKQPVFEVHFAKNKVSSFKGRLFYEFYPEMAFMQHVDEQTAKHYSSIVFSS